jgi:hypothetical protein
LDSLLASGVVSDSLLASGVVSVAESALPVSELASEVKLQLLGLPPTLVPPQRGQLQRWLPWQLQPPQTTDNGSNLEPSGPVTSQQVVMGSDGQ